MSDYLDIDWEECKMLNDYCRRLFKHQDAYYLNKARVSLYLYPDRFAQLAVRWYLAARAERELTKSV